jgi:hypothetical protein
MACYKSDMSVAQTKAAGRRIKSRYAPPHRRMAVIETGLKKGQKAGKK